MKFPLEEDIHLNSYKLEDQFLFNANLLSADCMVDIVLDTRHITVN